MVQTLQLKGTEKRLYQLVAPLVMNPDILRMNNNYPFKTSDQYIWFIAMESKTVIGFMPVEQRNGVAIINNYYIDEKKSKYLQLLVEEVTSALEADYNLSSVTLIEHQTVFEKCGFVVEKEWKRYVKMRKE